MFSDKERRQLPRIAVDGVLQVSLVPALRPLRLLDVGPGGFLVHTTGPLPDNCVLSFQFTNAAIVIAVLPGRVVHSRHRNASTDSHECVIGIAFEDPGNHTVLDGIDKVLDCAIGVVEIK